MIPLHETVDPGRDIDQSAPIQLHETVELGRDNDRRSDTGMGYDGLFSPVIHIF